MPPAGEGPCPESHHRLPHLEGVGVTGQRRAKTHRDAIGDAARPLEEKASALETEDAAPYTVEVNGNNGNGKAARDALKAAAKTEQIPRPRDRSLGEDADQVALAQAVLGGVQRFHQFAWFVRLGNRNCPH